MADRRWLTRGSTIVVAIGLIFSGLDVLPAPPAHGAEQSPGLGPLVELVERRTETTKTFATGQANRFLTKAYSGSVHYRDASGTWQDIRTELVAAGVGRVASAANDIRLDLALNAADPALGKVAVDGDHSVAFRLEGAQARPGVPVGSEVTYPGVLAGVDLKLTSAKAGLKEELVLASRQVPDTFLFPMALRGLTAELEPATGDVVYRDEAGVERLRTPHGFMTDSNVDPRSGEAPRSEGVSYDLLPHGDGLALRVRLDRAWLDDPVRAYPVTVDPSYWNSTTLEDDTFVSEGYTADEASNPELRVGKPATDPRLRVSFMNFDVHQLDGKVIESAVFNVLNNWSWSCDPRGLGVYRVLAPWSGHQMTTWGSQPATGERVGWAAFAMGYEPGGCSDGWAGFGQDGVGNFMLDTVRNWTSNAWGEFGLALKVDPGSENDTFAWKKFASWNACGGGSCIPHIDIYWSEPNRDPFGSLDVAAGDNGRVRVAGWGIDPDTTASIDVHVYIDGSFASAFTANGYRPDVGAAYPGYGDYHGFDRYMTTTAGTHSVCVYLLNIPSGNNPLLSCPTVSVPAPSPPPAPTVSSATHPSQSTWYANNDPQFTFSATDPAHGITGYSWTYDQSPATIPDDIPDANSPVTLIDRAEGTGWFHVKARNGANPNLWGLTTHYQVNIATTPNAVGAVEHAAGSRVTGWVHDPNDRTRPLTVNIHLDGAATPNATLTANLYRGNANPPASDGFEWIVPAQFRDGKEHRVKVEALDYPTNSPVWIADSTLSFLQLADDFTVGGNAPSWNAAKWTTSASDLTRTVDVQSDQGRLQVTTGTAVATAQTTPLVDGEVLFTYRFSDRLPESQFGIALRGSGATGAATMPSAYRLDISSGLATVNLQKVVGGIPTSLGSFSYVQDTNPQRVRFRVQSSSIKAKVWPAASPEPAAWSIERTDGDINAAGVLQLTHAALISTPRSVFVDDLVLTRIRTAREPNHTTAPPNSVSRYMNSGPETDFRALGQEEGNRTKANIGVNPQYAPMVVLHLGAQLDNFDGTTGLDGPDLTEQQVIDSAVAFIDGYYSTIPGRDLALGVGTNNSNFNTTDPDGGESDAKAKGADWAFVANQVWDRVKAAHPDMEVLGAQDFEEGDLFGGPAPNGPRNARAWVAGFDAQANGRLYINYGAADGCPQSGSTATAQPCLTGEHPNASQAWNQDDWWFLSRGVFASRGTLPQIYNIPEKSRHWQQVSVYGYKAYAQNFFDRDGRIDFLGTLTQQAACQQRGCGTGADTAPTGAWNDFRATLDTNDGNEITKGEPLGHTSDIRWQIP